MAKDVKGNTSPEGKTNKKAGAAVEAETVDVKKEEPKKAEAPKAQPKKEAAAPAKKSAAKTQKAVKAPLVPELFVQYEDDPAGAQEANVSEIVARVKAAYVAEGHRESSIKSLKVYMKPQEWKAYYVINNKIEGQINLF